MKKLVLVLLIGIATGMLLARRSDWQASYEARVYREMWRQEFLAHDSTRLRYLEAVGKRAEDVLALGRTVERKAMNP
jgi:hypothetical protein